MDKILSARIDERSAALLDALSRKLGRSKKSIIEDALEAFARQAEAGTGLDVLEETWGAWKRAEPAEATVRKARKAFRSSLGRKTP
jgi:hypothetical protein